MCHIDGTSTATHKYGLHYLFGVEVEDLDLFWISIRCYLVLSHRHIQDGDISTTVQAERDAISQYNNNSN